MKLFDSHIHICTGSISGWENNKDWIFNNVSITLDDFYKCLEQASSHDHVFVTAGIHPLEIGGDLEETMALLNKGIQENRDKVIAIGETGLDFYKLSKEEGFEGQKRWLLAHSELAKKHQLPLMLHIRSAHLEALEILEGIEDGYGVIHSFDGSEEIANRYLNLKGNWMLSISPLIFRETNELKNYIKNIDINRLLVESDAPFLGKSFDIIEKTISLIAEAKGMEFSECQRILWDNFCRFFKLDRLNNVR